MKAKIPKELFEKVTYLIQENPDNKEEVRISAQVPPELGLNPTQGFVCNACHVDGKNAWGKTIKKLDLKGETNFNKIYQKFIKPHIVTEEVIIDFFLHQLFAQCYETGKILIELGKYKQKRALR